jgi:Ca2+-binding RTX toxin-like protein
VIHARGTPHSNLFPTMEVWVGGVKLQTFTVEATSFTAYTVNVPVGTQAREVAVAFTNDAYTPATGEDRNIFIDRIVINGQTIRSNAPGVVLDKGPAASAFDGFNTSAGSSTLSSNGSLRFSLTGADLLDGGSGIDTLRGGIGNDVYVVDNAADQIEEDSAAGHDLVKSSVDYILSENVEDLNLTGSANLNGTGNAGQNSLLGNSGSNRLDGGAGRDFMAGGLGDDTYVVDNTGDVTSEVANAGIDTTESSITWTLQANIEHLLLSGTAAINGTGNTLNNLITGNSAANTLNGGTGNDILDGGDGDDVLTDTSGAALFNGGAGNDSLSGGSAAEIYLGGTGNDTLTTGAGNDVLLFNKGDGLDTLAAGASGQDTLSLGGSASYSEFTFSKSSNDLVLKVGASDQITFKDWYASSPTRSVTTLQVMAEAMADFTPGGADPLRDNKVEAFNFAGLVGAFDAARTATPTLTDWALTNALADFQLAGSDTAALGGDLAYQYGRNGTLAGIGVTPALDVLSNAALGTSAQVLTPLSGLQVGTQRLS